MLKLPENNVKLLYKHYNTLAIHIALSSFKINTIPFINKLTITNKPFWNP